MELPTLELANSYKPLSLWLDQVMECYGVNIENRNMCMKMATTVEILGTLPYLQHYSAYIFGSQYEGTMLPYILSDIDMVFVFNQPELVTNISQSRTGNCLLLIQDNSTPAGYSKLQWVLNGVPLFKGGPSWLVMLNHSSLSVCCDNEDRLICYFQFPEGLPTEWDHKFHGPACTWKVFGENALDFVNAFRSNSWPDCAAEWLSRKRNYNWPSSDLIEQCQSMGFLVVPAGHPKSEERHLQWRISLSHQERLLVTHFKSVQLKCYILLKQIKKYILEPITKEEKSLTSYHCKTCMFYMIENTEPDFWKPDNLVVCVSTCLRMIQKWARNSMCPNYFIPDENLFKALSTDVMKTLDNEIQKILSSAFENILQYIEVYRHAVMQIDSRPLGTMDIRARFCFVVNAVCTNRNAILRFYCNRELESCVNSLMQLDDVKESFDVKFHTEQETKSALDLILPLIKPTLLTHMVALGIQQCKTKQDIWKILTSVEWTQSNRTTDSSKLKHASVLHTLGYFSNSLEVLAPLNNVKKASYCKCYSNVSDRQKSIDKQKEFTLQVITERPNITIKDFLTDVITPCIVFLPTENDVTHIAINYEMIRSVGVPFPSNPYKTYWYNWAVVDGQFLFHFLLYLNHSKLHQSYKAKDDIKNMEQTINKRNVSHAETCQNLLGWVYKEQGHIDKAFECFRKSLKIQPFHNAAVWHVCFLICETLSRVSCTGETPQDVD